MTPREQTLAEIDRRAAQIAGAERGVIAAARTWRSKRMNFGLSQGRKVTLAEAEDELDCSIAALNALGQERPSRTCSGLDALTARLMDERAAEIIALRAERDRLRVVLKDVQGRLRVGSVEWNHIAKALGNE